MRPWKDKRKPRLVPPPAEVAPAERDLLSLEGERTVRREADHPSLHAVGDESSDADVIDIATGRLVASLDPEGPAAS